jgi:multifunctional beta-oxidation protein
VEIVDKGKAAIVVHKYRTTIESTGEDVFYVEETTFIRGSGNFGGQKHGTDRGAATAANDPPPRKPGVTIVETTSPDAAALYRLSGDTNPLHIDPAVAEAGGLDRPILHGLCTFGISGKHIYSTFGPFRNIKARFINTVLPGQTLQTDMWKENGKVIFQTTILETGKLALAAAAVTLVNTKPSL